MQTGKVKFYNREKRYGFITGDDGVDYFFIDHLKFQKYYLHPFDLSCWRVVYNPYLP